MPRQVLTVEDSGDALDRQPPVDRLGNQSAQNVKNVIWNFISRLTTVFRVMLPQIEEDSLFSESTPPSPSPPWHSGDSVKSILVVLWQCIDRTDFRIRYAFGLLESNLRAITQRINLTTNWLMRLARRVGRAEELLLLLDRSLALVEEQVHQILFQMPKGGAEPKSRPGSGKTSKTSSSSQKRPSGRLSKLQRIAATKSAKRKSAAATAKNDEKLQDRLLQMESEIDKMAERISRLMKQMRNLEKALRGHHLLDGPLSESEPSEMD